MPYLAASLARQPCTFSRRLGKGDAELHKGPHGRRNLALPMGEDKLDGQFEVCDALVDHPRWEEVLHRLRHDGNAVACGSHTDRRDEILHAIVQVRRETAGLLQRSLDASRSLAQLLDRAVGQMQGAVRLA